MPLPKAKEYALEFVRGLRTGQRTTDPVAHLNRLSIQEEPDEGTPNPELMEEAPDYKGVIETATSGLSDASTIFSGSYSTLKMATAATAFLPTFLSKDHFRSAAFKG
jgi:hypothetical protein